MLGDYLTEGMVQLDTEGIRTPEEAIRLCGKLLMEGGKIKPEYIDQMAAAFHDLGPYIVLAPGIAMAHARPSDAVLEPCISMIRLNTPISFGHSHNDPVWLVFALGGPEDDGHLELLQELGKFLEKEDMMKQLETVKNYTELSGLF